MNCQEFTLRLDDFVDGTLSAAERTAAAEHRDQCPACRAAEARVSLLLAHAASLPRAVAPERDLWPGIAARIEKRNVLRGVFGGAGRLRWPRLGASAAAAAALVVVSSLVTAVLVARRAPAPAPSGVSTGVTAASLQLTQVRGTYEAARTQLLAALAARRGSLSPATLKVVEDNLAIVDTAVHNMEQALARDPGNRELPALLVTAYRQEIDLLQRATRIPARG
ncbi:MAG: zf-HC2 domain-containing protein [Thermoanaerobaculaceae bacterium]|nr:zf-HC2 domain-containing protein [Thermoanaerobaculaceae bacterium]